LSTDAVIAVRDLFKVFGSAAKVDALRGLNLTVAPGEFVAVMGASGSGKSTLLHLLAGLDRPTAGSIHLAGTDLACLGEDDRAEMRRHRLGLIFQAFHLLETLTAEENVLLPLAIAGRPTREARGRAAAALECVGLTHRRQHRPDQMSGGEKQRVAIARALVIDPLILLADEPTGNLDSSQGGRIMDLLRTLVDHRHHTLLMVTHDPSHAARADRILYLHDGRLVEQPTPPSGPAAPEPALLPYPPPGSGNQWTHGTCPRGTSHSVLRVPGVIDAGPMNFAPGVFFVRPEPNPGGRSAREAA
jgi:putative ABC transport system ATP-binding protein